MIHPQLLALVNQVPLTKGTIVIVQADSGEDIGIIRDRILLSTYRPDTQTTGPRGHGFALGIASDQNVLHFTPDINAGFYWEKFFGKKFWKKSSDCVGKSVVNIL